MYFIALDTYHYLSFWIALFDFATERIKSARSFGGNQYIKKYSDVNDYTIAILYSVYLYENH